MDDEFESSPVDIVLMANVMLSLSQIDITQPIVQCTRTKTVRKTAKTHENYVQLRVIKWLGYGDWCIHVNIQTYNAMIMNNFMTVSTHLAAGHMAITHLTTAE